MGSLESVSSDYLEAACVLKISDAELTSLDLDIIGQNTSSKAYDGSGVLRAENISSLESLNLTVAQADCEGQLGECIKRLRNLEAS